MKHVKKVWLLCFVALVLSVNVAHADEYQEQADMAKMDADTAQADADAAALHTEQGDFEDQTQSARDRGALITGMLDQILWAVYLAFINAEETLAKESEVAFDAEYKVGTNTDPKGQMEEGDFDYGFDNFADARDHYEAAKTAFEAAQGEAETWSASHTTWDMSIQEATDWLGENGY